MKNFFAKLMSWNSNQAKDWKKGAAEQKVRQAQQMENQVHEEERQAAEHMRQEPAPEPVIDPSAPSESQ